MNYQFTKMHPLRLFLGLLTIILVGELSIMFVLDQVLPSSFPQWLEASVDAGLLTVLCAPFFWRFFLRPLQSALEQESVKAQVAMEMAAEGIIVLDETGAIKSFNRAAKQIFGYSENEIRGKNFLCLLALPGTETAGQHDFAHYFGMQGAQLREAQGVHKNGVVFPAELAIGELNLAGDRQFTAIVRDITARKQAQKQLEQANEQLSSIFAHIHGLIAYLDTRFNFIRVNQAYAEADQQVPEYFAGKNHFEFFPDADNEAIFRRVLESGEPYRVMAKPFQYADHPERGVTYWDWGLYPVKNAAGKVDGLLLFLNDVTEQQRASMALQESEERYRVLFDSISDIIFLHKTGPEHQRGNFIEVNQAACQQLGYSREEFLNMRLRDVNLPGYPRDLDSFKEKVARQGQGVTESIYVAKGKRVFPVEISAKRITYRGEPMILSMVRDITERKQAERDKEELRRNMQALLNAIQESTFLMEREGKMLIINEVGAHRLNMTPEELVGRNVYEILPPEVARSRQERFEQVAQRGMPDTFEDERAGQRFQSTIYPVRDDHGEIVRFAVYAADVTQQRRLQGIEELFPAINQLVLQGTPLPAVLTFICNRVASLFNFAVAWVGRKEPDGTISVLASGGSVSNYVDQLKQVGVRWDDTSKGRGPAGSAIRSGQPQVLKVNDPRFQAWGQIALENNLQAMLGIPLVMRGEVYGVFTLYSGDPAFFDTPPVVTMLAGIATRVSVAIEAAMDQQQVRLLSSALKAAGNGVMITNVRGIIQWVNPAFSKLSGYSKEELIGQTPRILKSGRQPAAYYQVLWETIARGETWSSETIERAKDGSLYTVSQTITPISSDGGEITHYIAIHENITAQKLAQERIEHMAHYDALTGLPNRALFYDRLGQAFVMARRNQGGLTLLFMDLDGFKQVNDSAGHHIGDLLLKSVAERLRQCVRESDTVARLGGDEFTIVLNETHEHDAVARIAEKIIGAISRPFNLEGHEVHVGVSIGIARYTEEAGSEDSLVNNADQAMYAAKLAGKNTYRFSSTDQASTG